LWRAAITGRLCSAAELTVEGRCGVQRKASRRGRMELIASWTDLGQSIDRVLSHGAPAADSILLAHVDCRFTATTYVPSSLLSTCLPGGIRLLLLLLLL